MIPISETRFQQRLRPFPAIPAERGELRREGRLEQALPVDGHFESVRSWREGRSPDFRRACSAGQLLFQVVGIAGYADRDRVRCSVEEADSIAGSFSAM